jgi:hypothetical protein
MDEPERAWRPSLVIKNKTKPFCHSKITVFNIRNKFSPLRDLDLKARLASKSKSRPPRRLGQEKIPLESGEKFSSPRPGLEKS